MISRLLPVFAIILAVGLFLGYINPTYSNEISATKAQIASYQSALTAADQFHQKEAQLTRDRAAIPADKLARLETFLPDSVDNIRLILDLDALAARSGITLSNFDIGSSNGTGKSGTGGAAAPSAGTTVTTPAIPASSVVKSSATPAAAAGGTALGAGMPTGLGAVALAPQSPTESLDITVSATGSYPAFRSFLQGLEQSLRPLDVVSVTVHNSATGVYTYDLAIRIYWLR